MATVVAVTTTITALAVMGLFGLFETIGIAGRASAADIDVKIEKALEPVNTRLQSIESHQEEQGTYIERLVKSDIAKDIYAEKVAWCKAEGNSEKQRLRRELDELQEEYERVAGNGKHATEPNCND